MRRDVRGRVVLLTGASRGIGRRVAERLAARGARLALVSRSVAELESLKKELPENCAEIFPCDLTDNEARAKLVADVAARFGGEEFSILLPQTTKDEAAAIAERIRQNVEHSDIPHRRVTLSIGIASCSAELCLAPNIIAAADKALYEAKHAGRNRVRNYDETDAK